MGRPPLVPGHGYETWMNVRQSCYPIDVSDPDQSKLFHNVRKIRENCVDRNVKSHFEQNLRAAAGIYTV